MTHFRENIEAGIALLDASDIPDWRSRVDLRTLYMGEPTLCVLGQVFGGGINGYMNGLYFLGLDADETAAEYGFEPLEVAEHEVPIHADYRSLTEMWREYLT